MRILLLALAALAASESLAEACTCISSGPPCQATWQADAVLSARVLSIEAVVAGEPTEGAWRSRRVRMRVTEVFRNVAVAEVDVFTGSGGGDCGYNFAVGSDYLIYAYRHPNDGRLGTGICSRTRSLADAADDLRYLRGPARQMAPGRGQLVGTVRRRDPAPDGMSVTWVPVQDVSVTAEGDRTYRARTAADGSFEMAVLAGKYQVTVDLPDELYIHGPTPAEVRDLRGCAEVTLVPQWNGRVAGRVLNAAGDPLPGFAVELLPVASSKDGRFSPEFQARTDAEGRYEISRIVLPERVTLAEVSGAVLSPDGTPARGAKVYVRLDTDESVGLPPPGVTSKDGRFSMTVIAGRQYRVTAEGYENGRYASRAEVRGIDAGEHVKGLKLDLKPLKSSGSAR
jgi:hypothetical protein